MKKNSEQRKEFLTLVVVFAGVLVISALVVYLIGGRRNAADDGAQPTEQSGAVVRESPERRVPTDDTGNETFIDRLFGTHNDTFAANRKSGLHERLQPARARYIRQSPSGERQEPFPSTSRQHEVTVAQLANIISPFR